MNNAQRNVASTTISHDLIAGNEDAESHTHRQHDRGKISAIFLEDVEREEANELRAHLSDSEVSFLRVVHLSQSVQDWKRASRTHAAYLTMITKVE